MPRSTRPTTLATLALAVSCALALAACSDTSAPDTGQPFTAQQTADIGDAADNEAGETTSAFIVEDAADPTVVDDGSFAVAAREPAPALDVKGTLPSLSLWMPPSCATVSPNPPANPDGDRVPTDVTISFDPATCTRTSPSGTTVKVFGTRHITDPFPDAAGFDRDVTLTNLGLEVDHADSVLKVTRNGTRQVRGAQSGIDLTQDITALRQRTGRPDVTVHKTGTANFTPDAGATLVVGQPRPSGAITLTGTETYRGKVSADFTLQTVTPLHYNAGCADLGFGPARRIDAGELHLTRTVDGVSKGYLRLVWSACGVAPTREFVGQ